MILLTEVGIPSYLTFIIFAIGIGFGIFCIVVLLLYCKFRARKLGKLKRHAAYFTPSHEVSGTFHGNLISNNNNNNINNGNKKIQSGTNIAQQVNNKATTSTKQNSNRKTDDPICKVTIPQIPSKVNTFVKPNSSIQNQDAGVNTTKPINTTNADSVNKSNYLHPEGAKIKNGKNGNKNKILHNQIDPYELSSIDMETSGVYGVMEKSIDILREKQNILEEQNRALKCGGPGYFDKIVNGTNLQASTPLVNYVLPTLEENFIEPSSNPNKHSELNATEKNEQNMVCTNSHQSGDHLTTYNTVMINNYETEPLVPPEDISNVRENLIDPRYRRHSETLLNLYDPISLKNIVKNGSNSLKLIYSPKLLTPQRLANFLDRKGRHKSLAEISLADKRGSISAHPQLLIPIQLNSNTNGFSQLHSSGPFTNLLTPNQTVAVGGKHDTLAETEDIFQTVDPSNHQYLNNNLLQYPSQTLKHFPNLSGLPDIPEDESNLSSCPSNENINKKYINTSKSNPSKDNVDSEADNGGIHCTFNSAKSSKSPVISNTSTTGSGFLCQFSPDVESFDGLHINLSDQTPLLLNPTGVKDKFVKHLPTSTFCLSQLANTQNIHSINSTPKMVNREPSSLEIVQNIITSSGGTYAVFPKLIRSSSAGHERIITPDITAVI